MKKTRITITHQLEKTKYVFLVIDPNKLAQSEYEKIIKCMNVEMILVNGKIYKK